MARLCTPIAEELVPCPTPWEVARKLSHLPHLLFLDSADSHSPHSRYSYVMANPVRRLDSLNELPLTPTHQTTSDLPPFQGGFAGMLAYELAHQLERLPTRKHTNIPDFVFYEYPWVVSFDHYRNRSWIVYSSNTQNNELHNDAIKQFREIHDWLKIDTPTVSASAVETVKQPVDGIPLPHNPGVFSNFSRHDYIAAVRRVIDYIHAGDCFQVNLSQRLHTQQRAHSLEYYGRLRQLSPAPFACYFDLGSQQVISASPERFLQLHADGKIVTRPIKGTRPRGTSTQEDADLIKDLLTNTKDRAENIMIVDLLRNDIGRVSEYGSICVPRICELESYPYVHHLVSEVQGQLRSDRSAVDLLRAAFPGGSITGAPKVRAMEIISELEPTPRGAYCGSMGYLGYDGAMDTNILIRTFTASNGLLQFPVGGGIVADSDPEREYEETLHKAAGMLRTIHSFDTHTPSS